MRFKNLLQNIRKKRKETERASKVYTGSCCIDEMSTLVPVDYIEPEVISTFLIGGEQIWGKKIAEMKLDQFNASCFDNYIDQMIAAALSDIERQRISHKNALLDIKIGQESRIQILKNELEQIEGEINILRNEVIV